MTEKKEMSSEDEEQLRKGRKELISILKNAREMISESEKKNKIETDKIKRKYYSFWKYIHDKFL